MNAFMQAYAYTLLAHTCSDGSSLGELSGKNQCPYNYIFNLSHLVAFHNVQYITTIQS